jgi:hypothetical protein
MFQKLCIVHQFSSGSSNSSSFREQSTKRHDDHTIMDTCILGSSIFIEHIINLVQHRIRTIQRLKIDDNINLIKRSRSMKLGFNEGIRSVSVDRSVA